MSLPDPQLLHPHPLDLCARHWQYQVIAAQLQQVDLMCANRNLHHYGRYYYLRQIFLLIKNFVYTVL